MYYVKTRNIKLKLLHKNVLNIQNKLITTYIITKYIALYLLIFLSY